MNFTLRASLVLLILFGLAAYGVYWYYGDEATNAVVFKTAPLQRGDLLASIGANGTVEPEDLVDVGAQVAGQILEFGKDADGNSIDYGSVVTQGMVLARIDDFPYKVELLLANDRVEQSKASLQKAEADTELSKAKHYLAEADWERAQKMIASNTLAVASFDSFKAAFETSKASVAVSAASVAQAMSEVSQAVNSLSKAKQNLSYCIIKSPVDGVVIDRRVNIGQTVVSSLNAPSLFLIAKDLRRMQVWVAVNEADIGKIHTGQPVSFMVSSFPGENFKGEVHKIRLNATMTQNVVTYIVEVLADNSSGRLLPFLTANVKFELNRMDNVIMAPNAALRWMPKSLKQVDPGFRDMFSDAGGGLSSSQAKDKAASKASEDKVLARPDANFKNGVLWVKKGDYIRPVKVKVGLTDGIMSEVIGDDLADGLEVIIKDQPKKTIEMVVNPLSTQGVMAGKRK